MDAGANIDYAVIGLSAAQAYHFAVSAYTADAESIPSEELTCYFVTAAVTTNGQITPGGSTPVQAGSSQTFSIIPDKGYSVSNVLIDGVSTGPVVSYSFSNVAAAHTISATFSPNTYTITPTAGANGTISPSAAVSASYGSNQTFTITPATGYVTSDVKVDGQSVGPVASYTFSNVVAAHTITAKFSPITYTITANAGAYGTISPSGAVSVTSGANMTFTISPAARSQIANIFVDGKPIGAVSSYTFKKVTANHSIWATFAPMGRVRVQATAQGGGSISPAGTVNVAAGANRSFTIKPAAGHGLISLLVDGTPVSAVFPTNRRSAGGRMLPAPTPSQTSPPIIRSVPFFPKSLLRL